MKYMKSALVALVCLICVVTVGMIWVVKNQGVQLDEYRLGNANVKFDAHGIPTIIADDWDQLIFAQGYVVASERLFQMEMIRRMSAGRLSEWFGSAALESDKEKIFNDWPGVARRAVEELSEDDRKYCDVYAKGVNEFIDKHPNSWGLEFSILRQTPEPWSCSDSVLVLLYMADFLTASSEMEARQWAWREKLTEEWQAYLFPRSHPWSQPLFGRKNSSPTPVPPEWQYLPKGPLKQHEAAVSEPFYYIGSNAWAWTSHKNTFLAGDPHLSQSVPQVWYANRLRISKDQWVVGASLPGVPGVVIGRNQSFAWTFTNLGEDVDDLLEEKINEDQTEYVAFVEQGRPNWQRIVKKKAVIKVKDREDVIVERLFTHRGPLQKRADMGNRFFSRQWSALKPGFLGMPVVSLNRATSWQDVNSGIDRMKSPAQCLLFADNNGRIGYRASGVDFKRHISGLVPQKALHGEWQSSGSTKDRKRILFRKVSPQGRSKFIVNANQQIWREKSFGHHWASEDRAERITRFLKSKQEFDLNDMRELQQDTQSRFMQLLLKWVAIHQKSKIPAAAELAKKWKAWDGVAETATGYFSSAILIEQVMADQLLSRVVDHFWQGEDGVPKYKHSMKRAWMLRVITKRRGAAIFGLKDQELATYLMDQALQSTQANAPKYPEQNAWQAQHPFVGRVPLIGNLFKVKSYQQVGYRNLVKAERPNYGPSMRVVWDMNTLHNSRWIFPAGQSGHIRSRHYRGMQELWHTNKAIEVFPQEYQWR